MRLGLILECAPGGSDQQVFEHFLEVLNPKIEVATRTLVNKARLKAECGYAVKELLEDGCKRIGIVWDLFPPWRQKKLRDEHCRGRDRKDIRKSLVAAGVENSPIELICITEELEAWMLADIAGIGQAAIGGVTEALLESAAGQGTTPVQQSAEHLTAVNQILAALSGVVYEVRVRVYTNLPEGTQEVRGSMLAHYQQKLRGTNWDNVVRINEDDTRVVVCALRSEGAIRGLFVIVSEDTDLVMVNVVCELTPDKVSQVTSQATKIGLKVGLEQAIQEAIRRMPPGRP